LPPGVQYIRGQLECGAGGYLHWQCLVSFPKKIRLGGVTRVFGPVHAEPTRSEKADDYVWKEDTRVEGTQFELGIRKLKRNSGTDWEIVRKFAQEGKLQEIEPDIYIR